MKNLLSRFLVGSCVPRNTRLRGRTQTVQQSIDHQSFVRADTPTPPRPRLSGRIYSIETLAHRDGVGHARQLLARLGIINYGASTPLSGGRSIKSIPHALSVPCCRSILRHCAISACVSGCSYQRTTPLTRTSVALAGALQAARNVAPATRMIVARISSTFPNYCYLRP